jgi:hypothetical protein
MAYSQEIADAICERISNGEPLRKICQDDGMPAWRTVYDWLAEKQEFAARIARAREMGFDAIAQQALMIADTPFEGEEVTEKATGIEIRRGDMLGHRKLQIETRLKLLAKWDPKRYGDKIEQTVQGGDKPVEHKHSVTLTPEEAYKRMLDGE